MNQPQAFLPNLYESLLRTVSGDHGGVGELHVHRAFDRSTSDGEVAFIDLVIVPPGSTIGEHRHGDDRETYVILRGTATMIRDGERFAVCTGDVIVNSPWGVHGLINDSDADVHLLVFEVAPVVEP
jgi:quercetin dioxygenase-like cupin family protein